MQLVIEDGDPVKEIPRHAEEDADNVIVMGSYGLGDLARVTHGQRVPQGVSFGQTGMHHREMTDWQELFKHAPFSGKIG